MYFELFILQSTEKLHPDIQPLKEASSAVDELCNHINECKRRKDIGMATLALLYFFNIN